MRVPSGSIAFILYIAEFAHEKWFADYCKPFVLCVWRACICVTDAAQHFYKLSVWQNAWDRKTKFQENSCNIGNGC